MAACPRAGIGRALLGKEADVVPSLDAVEEREEPDGLIGDLGAF
jgi:hypothetical protein